MDNKTMKYIQYTMLTIALLIIGSSLLYMLIQLAMAGLYQILIHTERSAVVLTIIGLIVILVPRLRKKLGRVN